MPCAAAGLSNTSSLGGEARNTDLSWPGRRTLAATEPFWTSDDDFL